jgi:hypothetical protein
MEIKGRLGDNPLRSCEAKWQTVASEKGTEIFACQIGTPLSSQDIEASQQLPLNKAISQFEKKHRYGIILKSPKSHRNWRDTSSKSQLSNDHLTNDE